MVVAVMAPGLCWDNELGGRSLVSAIVSPAIDHDNNDLLNLGGAMIKSPKILYCPLAFFSLGIPRYVSIRWIQIFKKKIDQKCPVGGADDYCTGFC